MRSKARDGLVEHVFPKRQAIRYYLKTDAMNSQRPGDGVWGLDVVERNIPNGPERDGERLKMGRKRWHVHCVTSCRVLG